MIAGIAVVSEGTGFGDAREAAVRMSNERDEESMAALRAGTGGDENGREWEDIDPVAGAI